MKSIGPKDAKNGDIVVFKGHDNWCTCVYRVLEESGRLTIINIKPCNNSACREPIGTRMTLIEGFHVEKAHMSSALERIEEEP
jgi:hypothetical protein